MFYRKPRDKSMEGARAREIALSNLEQSREDREEVRRVSNFLRSHRMNNHWSIRIEELLKEGR